jgi:sugar lactone lactonase YvrE/enterochelin esterase-like enzyme
MKVFFLFIIAAAVGQTSWSAADLQVSPPKGAVTKYTWAQSKVFPATTRDYWVYVPAQYQASKPACAMIFQDGGGFVKEDGAWRVPAVFDNLIQQGAIPVTIGIFIDPGITQNRYNRSYEYDGLGDRYARFLLDEILPEVSKKYNLSTNPDDRAIAGSSSGGIAAFTAAWERPDAFHRVLSFIGSYTDLRGGDGYINLVRKMEPKPLRVFLQDGTNDLNIYSGSWYMANQSLAKSLDYAGYDVKFEVDSEGHNSKHGAAILPDALRWLWRDHPAPIKASAGGSGDRQFVTQILDPGHDWEIAAQGYKFTEGPAVAPDGSIYFCDAGDSKIYRIDPDNTVTLFKANSGGASGLMFRADGTLLAAEAARKRVVSYAKDGALSVLAQGVAPNDLAVTTAGIVYFTETGNQRVWMIDPKKGKRVVFDRENDGNMLMPNGVRLLPDESGLVVADTESRVAWSFRFLPDGSLIAGEPFYHLEIPDDVAQGPLRSGADGLTFDDQGYAYFATKLGVQICDQPGRVVGVIRRPGNDDISNLVFGGPDMQTLYATAGGTVYRRHLRRKGVLPWQPVSLPKPQL